MAEEKKQFKRLPKSVKPTNYDLTLEPDLEKFSFKGSAVIDVQVTRETKHVRMNCAEINISSATFEGPGETFAITTVKYDKDAETATCHFPYELPVCEGKLKLEFTGELNDKMKGFYRSKYKGASGEDKYCAVTQFEATDARRAFPCWDEPAIKATFDITIVAPKDRVTLSNMNVIDVKPHDTDENLHIVKFAKTPIMSTYLVAFVIGEFDYVEGTDRDGVLIRVYTPLGKHEQGKFALEIATKTLPFYNDYFGVAYPLPKLDLIAIPDFAAGAMENWGLVTYRETALLVDPQETSAGTRQWVALVVGHELAHQWFGNLTTMEWWTHLWLNEGFASWIEYLCVDYCCPDYDIWTQFCASDYVRALELDALKNSHPIEVPVGHPSEVDEIFDAISYCKGASVIRMLHQYLGDEAFKKGLNHYVNKFAYQNGQTEDLWMSLEHASGKPVGRVMTTWTSQMGFPVIDVSSEQAGSKRILKIKQSKFSADGSTSDQSRWIVPITVVTSDNPTVEKVSTVLSDPDMVLFIEDTPQNAWIKLNLGQAGFYRTKYSPEMLQALIPAIQGQVLGARDRLGIENDVFALASAGLMRTIDFLNILEGYSTEESYTVWNNINGNLGSLSIIMQYTSVYEDYKRFLTGIFKPIGEKVGWEAKPGEGHLDALLRSLVIGRLGKLGDEDTVAECRKRFEAHRSGGDKIQADLRAAVYGTVIAHGDETTLDQLIDLYKSTSHMEEKNRVLRILGGSDKPELIKKALEFAWSEEVRNQDTVFAIASCTGTAIGRELTWEFVQEKWSAVQERYEGGFIINRFVSTCTQNFASEEYAKKVEAFFSAHPTPSAERTIKQSVENIRLNSAWLQRDEEGIKEWLQKRASNSTTDSGVCEEGGSCCR